MQLEDLIQPINKVRGVGPHSLAVLQKAEINTIVDLLWHLPRDYEDRLVSVSLDQVRGSQPVWINTVVCVQSHEFFGKPPKRSLKVQVEDSGGRASLVCFGRDFLSRQLSVGKEIRLCGWAVRKFGETQLSAFDYEELDAQVSHFGMLLPRYPLLDDLGQAFFRKVIAYAIDNYGRHIQDYLPPTLIQKRNLIARPFALTQVHGPQSAVEAEACRQRLAYDELFLLQAGIARRVLEEKLAALGQDPSKLSTLAKQLEPLQFPALVKDLIVGLPFDLTAGQNSALGTILALMQQAWPLSLLLQGDVGCGKTLVALAAALAVIAEGGQAALLVPTVLLARQHAEKAASLLAPLGINVAIMAGTLTNKVKPGLLSALANGDAQLIIGTHGLFSDPVEYANLRLVIVDEQHRFGVVQRKALSAKAKVPNLLMMSATPIPQTLALTVFGDMEVFAIRDLPAQRKPIETHLARIGNEKKVYDWVRSQLALGRQAYFVYPLIDDGSASSDEGPQSGQLSFEGELKNAQAMFKTLSQEVFPEFSCSMVHSRLEEEEKQAAMRGFSNGTVQILVATSVVEVGVDVPNASCMVIEHAERFGLAALHQLRGRVGRGSEQSYCFLVYKEPLSDEGKARLKIIKEQNDGFVIAEQDLALRGPGDLRGLRQSGYLKLHAADLKRDMALMNQARADAFDLLEADPLLQESEHQALKHVLDLSLKNNKEGTSQV